LSKNPADRFTTAEELAEELGRWRRGDPIRTRPENWRQRGWRRARRHPIASLTAGFLLLAILAVLILRPWKEPEPAWLDFQRRLDARQPVTLIGDQGSPQWSQPFLGVAHAIQSPQKDGTFTLTAFQEPALLELLPPCRRSPYRLSAEVCHHDSDRGEVGIYFGHSQQPGLQGAEDCFGTWIFSDREALIPDDHNGLGSAVALTLWRWRFTQRNWRASLDQTHQHFQPALGQPGPQPWRRLEVVVGDQDIQFFWNDQPVRHPIVSRAQLRASFDERANSNPLNKFVMQLPLYPTAWCRGPEQVLAQVGDFALRYKAPRKPVNENTYNPQCQPEFLPQDGLGLYVYRGTVSFRKVTVAPLK
jgi:hypothetical protein